MLEKLLVRTYCETFGCFLIDSILPPFANGHCWGGGLFYLAVSIVSFNVVPCPPSPAWFYVVGLERGGYKLDTLTNYLSTLPAPPHFWQASQ